MNRKILVKDLGLRPLVEVWADMKRFTDQRDADSQDEIWFVEHPPVYTLGLNADLSHLLAPTDIEILQVDRGGQVTYHGPGQQVCYVMLDIKRLGLNVRSLVQLLESAVIDTVAAYRINANPRRDAPGVYVDGKKLAAVGLKLRRGCSYHGIAVNVDMDLAPFGSIQPCGIEGLEVTQLAQLCTAKEIGGFRSDLEQQLLAHLSLCRSGFQPRIKQ